MNFFHPEVQRRIGQSLAYFGGGLLATGGLVGALRNSKWAYMNPWLMLAISIGTMFGTMLTSY
jgi:hypothetical protein